MNDLFRALLARTAAWSPSSSTTMRPTRRTSSRGPSSPSRSATCRSPRTIPAAPRATCVRRRSTCGQVRRPEAASSRTTRTRRGRPGGDPVEHNDQLAQHCRHICSAHPGSDRGHNLPLEENTLAIMKWRLSQTPPADRWYPVQTLRHGLNVTQVAGKGRIAARCAPRGHSIHTCLRVPGGADPLCGDAHGRCATRRPRGRSSNR